MIVYNCIYFSVSRKYSFRSLPFACLVPPSSLPYVDKHKNHTLVNKGTTPAATSFQGPLKATSLRRSVGDVSLVVAGAVKSAVVLVKAIRFETLLALAAPKAGAVEHAVAFHFQLFHLVHPLFADLKPPQRAGIFARN